jgi:6-phosphogluconolactonase (cycloisomerase 2 family)
MTILAHLPIVLALAAPRGAALPVPCDAAAQARFDRGFFLLHNMMYTQARAEFEEAGRRGGGCAMAHWGIAMTWFQPLWSGQPTEEALKSGSAAIDKAMSLAGQSERDQAYIAAAAGYYRDWPKTDTAARLRNWEAGQRGLASRYPDDVEAQAFWALSRLATADRYDKSYGQQLEAARSLEALLQKRPEHPGLMHYLIHAYDNPAHAAHGTHLAKEYEGVAPHAPHALHMPSHIHVRLGNWTDVIEWNIKSAAAAREQPAEGGLVSRDYLHALDYLVYGYLQRGDDDSARAVLEKIDPRLKYQPGFGPAAYALAAVPARFALERGQWREAAALTPRSVDYSWERFAWAEAVTHAARGLGAARAGDAAAARASVAELDRLVPLVDSSWWKDRVQIDRDVVLAWLAHGGNDTQRGVELMTAAAAREVAAGKDPAEPGHVITAAEQLGLLLLESGRPKEALLAFEDALKDSPKRLAALHGAARAARAAELPDKVKHYHSELVAVCAPGSGRQACKEATAVPGPPRSLAAPPPGKVRVYVGTYTSGGSESKGIYRLQLDLATGALTPEGEPTPAVNPSFLAFHPGGKLLYAVNETGESRDDKPGMVSAFSIDPGTGGLTLLNQESSGGAAPCHLTLDAAGRHLLVANYAGGSAAVLPVGADGRLGPALLVARLDGRSVDPTRQEAPHVHSVTLDAANKYLLAADLGQDKVHVFQFDATRGTLAPHAPGFATVAPGSGPRHLAFHPGGRFAYVINEMLSTVSVFAYDPAAGALSERQTVGTLPRDFNGTSATAEVVVHPNGKFLYGSNRGHDSIALFTIDGKTGTLTPAGHQPTRGKRPRNFALDPTGTYLLAANQDSDTVAVFRIDQKTGRLEPVGEPVRVPRPVCLRMVTIAG